MAAESMKAEPTVIEVAGERPYQVLVGRGLFGRLPAALGPEVAKALIIHPPTLGPVAEAMRASLAAATSIEVLLAEIPDAEPAKRVEVAAFCWEVLGKSDFTRTDAIIGLGGGAATDLAGFVAATWLRGIAVVQVPTSVLGMVDAAIGGKTGINTAEGKNLVGAFWAPRAVLCDLDLLSTLPRNELLTGYAEIVKCGFIQDPRILELIETDTARATDPTTAVFRECVERAIAVKARVVGEDFTEQGLREILNYGHTLGHAIEHTERYLWRHGAAVSIGMVFAAELSRMTRGLSDDAVERHRRILGSLGLPTTYPGDRWAHLLGIMRRDKKARGAMLRFIGLDEVGRPVTIEGPEESLLFAAYQNIAEDDDEGHP
ncbi:MAG TPA: 3-dehydroquinate synthase [Microbacteriaceae bacterium]|nr:3-dehydroquinate synthase [Microbacteriaceae bacterium]